MVWFPSVKSDTDRTVAVVSGGLGIATCPWSGEWTAVSCLSAASAEQRATS